MGAIISQPNLPELPSDVIQAIIAQTSTSTILDSMLKVSEEWNEIGRRNAIWIPRYKQLTGIELDVKEYEAFPLFLEEWYKQTPIWLDESGHVVKVPEDVEWIDLKDPAHQKSHLLPRYLKIKDGKLYIVAGPYSSWTNYSPIKVLETTNRKEPYLYLFYREADKVGRVELLKFYTISPQNDLLE